jgi:hypothetical protein
MKNHLLYTCLLIITLSFANVVGTTVTAHNFSTDDNSTFLTLINMILIENRLINNSFIDSSADTSLHTNYVKNINEIIDDILVSEDSLLIDSDQFYNNTIIATMMANLGDEVLRKYGYAFGIPSNIMLYMNFSAVDNLEKNVIKDLNSEDHSSHDPFDIDNAGNYSANLKDKSQYYDALETSKRMIEIYENDLESADTSMQVNSSLSLLRKSLNNLYENIYNYNNPSKIMEIVHGKVHPNLQLAFNLTLKR